MKRHCNRLTYLIYGPDEGLIPNRLSKQDFIASMWFGRAQLCCVPDRSGFRFGIISTLSNRDSRPADRYDFVLWPVNNL